MRTLVRRNRFYPEIPSLFDEFFKNDWFDNSDFVMQGNTMPSVNVRESEDMYELEVAAPGMKKNDFKVELDNTILKITAEIEDKKEEKEDNFTRREFNYQSFCRTFHLPENKVDSGKIVARYNDGILHVTLPKLEEAKVKPVRMIDIK